MDGMLGILLFLAFFFNIHHGPSRSGSPRTIPVLGAYLWILYMDEISQNAEVMFALSYCPGSHCNSDLVEYPFCWLTHNAS